MTQNKEELSDWIEDIVAFHKIKLKFVSSKGYGIGRCEPVSNMRIQGL